MNTQNTLVAKDRRRKRVLKAHGILKKVTPILTVMLLAVAILTTFALAATEEQIKDNSNTFMTQAFTVIEIVIAIIGGGLALWGIVNLLEGYGNDNPGAKSQGMKQLMAGAGIILIAVLLIPYLKDFFFNTY